MAEQERIGGASGESWELWESLSADTVSLHQTNSLNPLCALQIMVQSLVQGPDYCPFCLSEHRGKAQHIYIEPRRDKTEAA